jgi:hypothetical protein
VVALVKDGAMENLVICAMETLEDSKNGLCVFWGDADAVVLYRKLPIETLVCRGYRQRWPTRLRRLGAGRLGGALSYGICGTLRGQKWQNRKPGRRCGRRGAGTGSEKQGNRENRETVLPQRPPRGRR